MSRREQGSPPPRAPKVVEPEHASAEDEAAWLRAQLKTSQNDLTATRSNLQYTLDSVKEFRAQQQKMYDEQQASKKKMEKFIDKHLHKGSSSMFDDGNAKKAKEMKEAAAAATVASVVERRNWKPLAFPIAPTLAVLVVIAAVQSTIPPVVDVDSGDETSSSSSEAVADGGVNGVKRLKIRPPLRPDWEKQILATL